MCMAGAKGSMSTRQRQSFRMCIFMNGLVTCSGDEAQWLDACVRGEPDQAQPWLSQPSQSSMRSKELEGLSADSDVLPVPVFVDAEGGSSLMDIISLAWTVQLLCIIFPHMSGKTRHQQ